MCIACELSFLNMFDALPAEERERILREQVEKFACEAAPAERTGEPEQESKP